MALTNFKEACQVLSLGKPLYGFYISMNRLGANSTRFDRNIKPTRVVLHSLELSEPSVWLKDIRINSGSFNYMLGGIFYESKDEVKLAYNNKIEELREDSKKIVDTFFDKHLYKVNT